MLVLGAATVLPLPVASAASADAAIGKCAAAEANDVEVTPSKAHPPCGEGARQAASDIIDGHYIVVYEDSAGKVRAETDERERRLEFESDLRYRSAVQGFSAELSPGQVRELRADPEVAFVSENRSVEATGDVPLAPGEPTPPTGTRRILAATGSTTREQSNANVAVIDTGIQLDHPDLNAVNGKNCVSPGSPANDGNGHGTHVAGSIAAKNNGAGVVGVTPNTKTYAVKVLGDSGSGTMADVVCGIDWVTANATAENIQVANMSLGGLGNPVRSCATTTDAMHKAICNSTAAGVNYVVAAGNAGQDFDDPSAPDVPAAYPEVLTVTALSDSDGKEGGTGPLSCRLGEQDDYPATFSNFAATPSGEAHTIAAPGVCIRSTWPGGSYRTISGTSMAAPHVAGLLALCIDEAGVKGACANSTTAQVIQQMRNAAQTFNQANRNFGFTGDPLHSPTSGKYFGFLTGIAPVPPASTALPAISGTARHEETLSASAGTWTGTQPITYSYQWRRCDSNGDSCAGISGATGSSYKLTSADVGRRLRIVVTAKNPGGTASATSTASTLVDTPPPDASSSSSSSSSSSPDAAPTAADDTAPQLLLAGSATQRVARAVKVSGSCDRACEVRAIGKLVVKQKRKRTTAKLKPAAASLAADRREKLKLGLSNKALKVLRAAAKQPGAKATAKLRVYATDAAGTTAIGDHIVKLTR